MTKLQTNQQEARRVILLTLVLLVFLAFLLLIYVLGQSNQSASNSQTPPTSYTTSTDQNQSSSGLIYNDLTEAEINSNVMLDQSDNFIVYLNDQREKTFEKFNIFDKKAQKFISIKESFAIDNLNVTRVEDSNDNTRIILSSGTYILRQTRVISLKQTSISGQFCMSIQNFVWHDYLIYENCDTFENRPWGAGEAPSIVALNLTNGQTQTLLKSDLTRQYNIENFDNSDFSNAFDYKESSVTNSTDWSNTAAPQTKLLTFDLTKLQ